MKKTEEQLALFEDMVKDNQLETEIKEQDKKFALLQDRKFAELDSLKSEDDEILSLDTLLKRILYICLSV